jgi:23S rRNA pseudouridine1911/1915/1917 synthase
VSRIAARTLEESPERPQSVPEGAVLTILRVPPEVAGMRLDRFVQSELKRTSRTRAQTIVHRSAFSAEGRPLRPSDRVRAEQRIYLWRPAWDETLPEVELPILYEDDHLLAVDKPAHTPVHPTARYYRSTVVKLLEAARPEQRFMLAHRLDRETSGVLLVSKTPHADRHVKRQFAGLDPLTSKPDRRGRRVELPLELDTDCTLRVKMRVAVEGGLTAATACTVAGRRVRPDTGARYALVRCTLETGRQHQIRLHLASRGLPLVGEKLYGSDERMFARAADGELTADDRATLELDRHALHAERLELDHPAEPRRIAVTAPLPPDLEAFWSTLAVVG